MRYVLGIILGAFSGFLIYMGSAMLLMDFSSGAEPSSIFVFVTFFGGWIVSSIFLIRGTQQTSKVLSRGFLLGAAEWLAMLPIGFILGGRAASTADTSTEAGATGAALGAGLITTLTGGVAIAMALFCLLGFAITYFMRREMKPDEEPRVPCPECAEDIKPEAKKCRYCGAELATSSR